ncbi:cupredoxin domain-containing protein [bacterium]|nr:cupredoxin domain-containing protein [bacterium]MCI0604423.1 cupredoxin domain-containing protein [bacterium]
MKFTYSKFFLAALLLFTLLSCGNNDNITTTMTPANQVLVMDNFYSPDSLKIPHGSTVTWSFQGHNPHTVTSGTQGDSSAGKLFDSVEVTSGVFEVTFDEPGIISYFCRLHGETGQLIVEGGF